MFASIVALERNLARSAARSETIMLQNRERRE
jgi:hypothetical protein